MPKMRLKPFTWECGLMAHGPSLSKVTIRHAIHMHSFHPPFCLRIIHMFAANLYFPILESSETHSATNTSPTTRREKRDPFTHRNIFRCSLSTFIIAHSTPSLTACLKSTQLRLILTHDHPSTYFSLLNTILLSFQSPYSLNLSSNHLSLNQGIVRLITFGSLVRDSKRELIVEKVSIWMRVAHSPSQYDRRWLLVYLSQIHPAVPWVHVCLLACEYSRITHCQVGS